jgi:hypothetical protein
VQLLGFVFQACRGHAESVKFTSDLNLGLKLLLVVGDTEMILTECHEDVSLIVQVGADERHFRL